MNDLGFVILVTVVIVTAILAKVLRGPIGDALGERLRGNTGSDPALLGELESVKARLAEVEERLDFTERLLAQQGQQPDRLPGRPDR